MPEPLPLAPRPCVGESLSGWVARLASRYDVTSADLCRHLLGGRDLGLDRIEGLDHQADPELLDLLAAAARMAPGKLRDMRVAVDDGTASCWHRTTTAWCPECIRKDLARGPEVYERATWRLGCTVVCPDHAVLLQDACSQCWKEDRCYFRHGGGWLRLACNFCVRMASPPDHLTERPKLGRTGAFHVVITPALTALVSELQRDLQAAILGAAPHRSWGFVRSGSSLLIVVCDMVLIIVLTARIRVDPRVKWVPATDRRPALSLVYEPITLAVLSPRTAFGALAVVAAVLDSVETGSGPGHKWVQEGVSPVIDAASFVAWLNDNERNRLHAMSNSWDRAVGAAFWA